MIYFSFTWQTFSCIGMHLFSVIKLDIRACCAEKSKISTILGILMLIYIFSFCQCVCVDFMRMYCILMCLMVVLSHQPTSLFTMSIWGCGFQLVPARRCDEDLVMPWRWTQTIQNLLYCSVCKHQPFTNRKNDSCCFRTIWNIGREIYNRTFKTYHIWDWICIQL